MAFQVALSLTANPDVGTAQGKKKKFLNTNHQDVIDWIWDQDRWVKVTHCFEYFVKYIVSKLSIHQLPSSPPFCISEQNENGMQLFPGLVLITGEIKYSQVFKTNPW